MFSEIKEIIEKFPNGNLKYIETIGIIPPIFSPLYPNSRIAPDGTIWCRIGWNKKFKENGKVQWDILYDQNGNILK